MADNKGGRPSIYSQDIATIICAKIADGHSLRKICREEGIPSLTTVFEWLAAKPDFAEQYARAREAQADAFADDMQDIADTPPAMTADGKIDAGDVADKRLRIDTRKWIASKLKPKKYGDKIEQEIKGDMSLTVNIVRFGEGE
jgi:hypothetical protein